MANTAPKIAEPERFDAPSLVDAKAKILAELIGESKHFIVYTGAGISTTAGIPDFRGPEGVWTLRAQKRQGTSKAVSTLQAVPTPTHMALVELQNRGLLKYIVSQNCDGLHRKSGILPDKISEVHGNSNREYCKDCGQEYMRDFRAVATYEKTVHDHRTGRTCALCGGILLDTIINFGEQLFEVPLKRARQNAKKADLCLVLGSSCTIPPASGIPETVGKSRKGKLAICNLQSTPLDDISESDLRVFARTDDLMSRIMAHLDIPIPEFILRRRLIVKVTAGDKDRHQLLVRGVDVDDTPATFLNSVKLEGNRRVARSEPFTVPFRSDTEGLENGTELKLELEFMGHYGEPNLEIVHEYTEGKEEQAYDFAYNPATGEWKSTKQD